MATWQTTEKIFPLRTMRSTQSTLIVRANGGSVVVSASPPEANDFVTTDTFVQDGGFPLIPGRLDVRVTPSGGAEYYLDREGD